MPEEKPNETQPAKTDSSILSDIKKENIEMQAELQKREEMLAHRDELKAREMLAGRAEAGNTPQPIPETAKDYANRVMKGQIKKS